MNYQYNKELKALLDYVKTIPKSSWQYEAIKQEILKIEKIRGHNVVTSFIEDDLVYPEINRQLVKNIWQVSKGEIEFRIFIKKLRKNKYVIKQM